MVYARVKTREKQNYIARAMRRDKELGFKLSQEKRMVSCVPLHLSEQLHTDILSVSRMSGT